MSTIDRQRIQAVRTLERSGYSFDGVEWAAPAGSVGTPPPSTDAADAMHALLVLRADKLAGCYGTVGGGGRARDDYQCSRGLRSSALV